MPLRLSKTMTLPIGVDLGTTTVKMAQLRTVDEDLHLIDAAMCDIPVALRENHSEQMQYTAEAIRKLMADSKFRGKECILSLPAEATTVKPIRIPKVSPEQVSQVVRWELRNELPYDVREAIVRHVLVGSEIYEDGEPKDEAIAFCTSMNTVKEYLQMARKAKLKVAGVTVETCATVECFARLFRRESDQDRTVMFVDLGAFTTQVAIMCGPRLVLARNLPYGGVDLDHTASEMLGVTPPEAHDMRVKARQSDQPTPETEYLYNCLEEPLSVLAGEIGECLAHHQMMFKTRQIERVAFVGGGALDKRLCQELSYRLDLPAQIGNPFIRVDMHRHPRISADLPQPDWAVAVGASVGATIAA